MRRDELRQPLRKQGLLNRFWMKRPGLLSVSYVAIALSFVSAGVWAMKTPMPFAGEPIVVVSIPPAKQVASTASTEPSAEPETSEAVEPETAEAPPPEPEGQEQIGEPEVAFDAPVRSAT